MAKDFGAELRKLREKANLTQQEVAKLLECSTPRISEWERGIRTPKPLTQEAIMARMKVAIEKQANKK